MRTELERRPALVVCLGMAVGVASVHHWIVAFGIFALLWAVRRIGVRLVAASAFAVGALISPPSQLRFIPEAKSARIEGVVSSVPRLSQGGSGCELDTDWGRMLLFWEAPPDLVFGDRVRLRARMRPPREGKETYLALRGIRGTATAEPGTIEIVARGSPLARLASSWRDAFVRHTAATLEPKAAIAVDALCFNVDGRLGPELREQLQRSGTTHIVSASGIHVLFLAVALQLLMSLLPIARAAQLLLLVAVLVVYATATGLRPPVVRACIMAAALVFAYLFRREGDLLAALGIAAAGYILFSPESVFDIGFQLSFTSVAGLALFQQSHFEAERRPLWRVAQHLRAVGRASLVATLATAPLVAYHFGYVSLISVLANVLITIALMPILVLSMFSLAILPFSDALATGLMRACVSPLAGWVLWVVETLGSWDLSALNVPEFSPYWLVPYYGAFLLVWRRRVRPA